MKFFSFRFVLVLMAVFLISINPRAWADEPENELSNATKGGIGCAILTGITLLGSLMAGPGELIMIAGGGSLAPSATTPLMISLTATVFVAACGVGIAATPAALWFFEQMDMAIDEFWKPNSVPAGHPDHQSESVLAKTDKSSNE